MGQQQHQGRNQMISWNKWKWEHNNSISMGYRENDPKREIHSIISLSQKTRNSSNKQSNFTFEGIWKRMANKAQSE